MSNNNKKYGFWRFMWDLFLFCITGGLWGLWLLFRHLRKNDWYFCPLLRWRKWAFGNVDRNLGKILRIVRIILVICPLFMAICPLLAHFCEIKVGFEYRLNLMKKGQKRLFLVDFDGFWGIFGCSDDVFGTKSPLAHFFFYLIVIKRLII